MKKLNAQRNTCHEEFKKEISMVFSALIFLICSDVFCTSCKCSTWRFHKSATTPYAGMTAGESLEAMIKSHGRCRVYIYPFYR